MTKTNKAYQKLIELVDSKMKYVDAINKVINDFNLNEDQIEEVECAFELRSQDN